MAVMISVGSVAVVDTVPPMPDITEDTTLPHTLNTADMISRALPTATFAKMKRTKWRRANSGRCISRKDAAD